MIAATHDPVEIVQAQEILRLSRDELRLMRSNPMAFYTPNGALEAFIKSIAEAHPDPFLHYLCAANRVGKGCLLVNIIGTLALGPQNKWFDYPLFNNFPKGWRGRIVGPHEGLEESVIRELHKWLPPGKYRTWKNGKQYDSLWEIGDCLFDVLTTNQDPEQFESATLMFFGEDEPLDEQRHSATVARLEPGGIGVVTATPLPGADYIFDNLDLDLSFDYGPPGWFTQTKSGNWAITFAHQYANTREHGIRGIYPVKWMEKKAEEYQEDEKSARIEGKPGVIAGRIFKLDPSVHLVDPFPIPDFWPRAWHIDTHFGNMPDYAVGIAVSPQEDWYVYAEAVLEREVPENGMELRHQVWRRDHILLCLIDPLANTVDPITKKTIKSVYDRALGLTTVSTGAEKCSKENGIRLVRELMNPVLGRPRMFFFRDRVPYTIWEMRRWRIDPRTKKPQAKNDHQMQGLYRLALQDLSFANYQRAGAIASGYQGQVDHVNPYMV